MAPRGQHWRISKYDPALRDAQGRLARDDWTSISDISRTHNGVVLTRAAYLAVEGAYVNAAVRFVAEAGDPPLFVRRLEAHDAAMGPASEGAAVALPVEGAAVAAGALGGLVRACLREQFWCCFDSADASVYVHFGYDFYMYVGSPSACPESLRFLRQAGLFAESVPRSALLDGDDANNNA